MGPPPGPERESGRRTGRRRRCLFRLSSSSRILLPRRSMRYPAQPFHLARSLAAALLLVLALAGTAAADWLGRPLTEALRELQSRGLRIVFTSQLVRPEMRVEAEPSSGDPRRILDEILAPHGLRAE